MLIGNKFRIKWDKFEIYEVELEKKLDMGVYE